MFGFNTSWSVLSCALLFRTHTPLMFATMSFRWATGNCTLSGTHHERIFGKLPCLWYFYLLHHHKPPPNSINLRRSLTKYLEHSRRAIIYGAATLVVVRVRERERDRALKIIPVGWSQINFPGVETIVQPEQNAIFAYIRGHKLENMWCCWLAAVAAAAAAADVVSRGLAGLPVRELRSARRPARMHPVGMTLSNAAGRQTPHQWQRENTVQTAPNSMLSSLPLSLTTRWCGQPKPDACESVSACVCHVPKRKYDDESPDHPTAPNSNNPLPKASPPLPPLCNREHILALAALYCVRCVRRMTLFDINVKRSTTLESRQLFGVCSIHGKNHCRSEIKTENKACIPHVMYQRLCVSTMGLHIIPFGRRNICNHLWRAAHMKRKMRKKNQICTHACGLSAHIRCVRVCVWESIFLCAKREFLMKLTCWMEHFVCIKAWQSGDTRSAGNFNFWLQLAYVRLLNWFQFAQPEAQLC